MVTIDCSIKSSNYDLRPHKDNPDLIIIHYTEMSNCEDAIKKLCDKTYKVSSHYIIDKKGKIFQLIDPLYRAWHAGISYWDQRYKINDFSIGIELDNNGYEDFTDELMDSVIKLCHYLILTYDISYKNILGHSDIAPDRKFDPGRKFNWQLLSKNGLGLYPNDSNKIFDIPEIIVLQDMLSKFGYKINKTNILDEQTQNVLRAFSEHFYPENIYNILDKKLVNKLNELLLLK